MLDMCNYTAANQTTTANNNYNKNPNNPTQATKQSRLSTDEPGQEGDRHITRMTGTDLQALNDLGHLVAAEIQETLDQVAVDEALPSFRLALRVKRTPAVVGSRNLQQQFGFSVGP